MSKIDIKKKIAKNLGVIYKALDKINDDIENSDIDDITNDTIYRHCLQIENIVNDLSSYLANKELSDNCYKDIETF